jgi:carbon storage regulator
MLVLSRKRWEQIVIGSEIRITVVRLEGSQVRLGIEAPEDFSIFRAELLEGGAALVEDETPPPSQSSVSPKG